MSRWTFCESYWPSALIHFWHLLLWSWFRFCLEVPGNLFYVKNVLWFNVFGVHQHLDPVMEIATNSICITWKCPWCCLSSRNKMVALLEFLQSSCRYFEHRLCLVWSTHSKFVTEFSGFDLDKLVLDTQTSAFSNSIRAITIISSSSWWCFRSPPLTRLATITEIQIPHKSPKNKSRIKKIIFISYCDYLVIVHI
jgi:hypothetical protein